MNWVARRANEVQNSPAMAPNYDPYGMQQQQQEDALGIVSDKHYAAHGKIAALTVIAIFSFFLVLVVFVPFLRRTAAKSESSDSVRWWSFPFLMLKRGRRRANSPPTATTEAPSRLKDDDEEMGRAVCN